MVILAFDEARFTPRHALLPKEARLFPKAGLLERAADSHAVATSDPAEARLLRKAGLLSSPRR
jgi:hypothetical protein